MDQLLHINNLVVAFENPQGDLTAVKGVSLTLKPGETLALVGESGCGKTVLCKSIMKLLCQKGRIRQGEIYLEEKDLAPLKQKQIETYRGRDVAMIFQDPKTSLDPTMAVGKQIAEAILVHEKSDKKQIRGNKSGKTQARERAIELLQLVNIKHPEIRYHQMPHQFSGGMCQRIAMAIALAAKPKLLLADEPTTSLDQETVAQILELLTSIQKQTGVAIIFISHDLSLVKDVADRVAIMLDGKIVETGSVTQVFQSPEHPYTKKLLGYLNYRSPQSHHHKNPEFLVQDDLIVTTASANGGRQVLYGSMHSDAGGYSLSADPKCLVQIRGLKKYFPMGKHQVNKVLDGLDMDIRKGEIQGLIGPSGCGKSTLARCIMEMHKPTGGTIQFHNANKNRNWKQMIFQDSDSALNPRKTLRQIIGEPLRISNGKTPKEEIVLSLMEQTELDPKLIDRYPYELSGGQRQRVAIARAISIDPELIIADEPISSLDISTQAQIVHLFRRLQQERELTILLIGHDLPMINHVSDRVIDMKTKGVRSI